MWSRVCSNMQQCRALGRAKREILGLGRAMGWICGGVYLGRAEHTSDRPPSAFSALVSLEVLDVEDAVN